MTAPLVQIIGMTFTPHTFSRRGTTRVFMRGNAGRKVSHSGNSHGAGTVRTKIGRLPLRGRREVHEHLSNCCRNRLKKASPFSRVA